MPTLPTPTGTRRKRYNEREEAPFPGLHYAVSRKKGRLAQMTRESGLPTMHSRDSATMRAGKRCPRCDGSVLWGECINCGREEN